MVNQKPKRIKKRIFSSWITSLVSISLVLTMLGILCLILISSNRLSDYVREKIGFTLVLEDNLDEADVTRLQESLNSFDFVKSTEYIDKEAAADELSEQLGEDFEGFLGYNPLFASIDVKLEAIYTRPDSMLMVEKKFTDFAEVEEVYYQKNLVSVINENVSKISLVIVFISALLLFIFTALINNMIRITIYSQRFTINTMQMVGASNSFIRKPFLQQSLYLGVYGALIANLVVLGAVYTYKKELTGIINQNDIFVAAQVFAMVVLLGLTISYLSTFFALNKFLKLKFDELF